VNIGKKRTDVNLLKHRSHGSIKTILNHVQVRRHETIINDIMFIIDLDIDHNYSNVSVPYFQEGYVHYVVDAVFTLVIAIQNLIDEKCQDMSTSKILCEQFFPLDGARLLTILRNVTFRNGKMLHIASLFSSTLLMY
jgi:hypothetical protein